MNKIYCYCYCYSLKTEVKKNHEAVTECNWTMQHHQEFSQVDRSEQVEAAAAQWSTQIKRTDQGPVPQESPANLHPWQWPGCTQRSQRPRFHQRCRHCTERWGRLGRWGWCWCWNWQWSHPSGPVPADQWLARSAVGAERLIKKSKLVQFNCWSGETV